MKPRRNPEARRGEEGGKKRGFELCEKGKKNKGEVAWRWWIGGDGRDASGYKLDGDQ